MFKKSTAILIIFLISGLLLFLAIPFASSADFPKRPIKLIVTAAAGGGEDTEARGIAPFLQKHLGVRIIIDDQPGAGGKIAFEKFQKTEPDGYSLITYTFPKSIVNEYLGKVNYRTRDYTSVFAWSRSDLVLVAHADAWGTFNEFLKAGKEKTLKGGLSGRGSNSHLAGLILVDGLGIKVSWVPYEGGGGSVVALAGKHLDFTITTPITALNLIQAGKLRALLMLGEKRHPDFPDIPVPKDLGLDINFIPLLRGLQAPPNTPASIVKILEAACYRAVKEPGFVDYAKRVKMVVHPLSAQEFGKTVVETYPKVEKFKELLKE